MIIPMENEMDIKEVPKEILKGLSIHPVENVDEVLAMALCEAREEQPIPALRPPDTDSTDAVTTKVDPLQTH